MKEKKIREEGVYRITVDERLHDDSIRLLRCRLRKGVTRFEDRTKYWRAEKEVLVNSKNFAAKMKIPAEQKKIWEWKNLKEGQVFLTGEFDLAGKGESTGTFEVKRGNKMFISIGDDVKKEVEKLYYKVIERR